jgi:ElaB/YqjD/DUF883 family membrane-anchored ribosome-binding protein
MDHSAEMSIQETLAIRNQMDETRTALTEKLELLEKQVSDTVQGAADTVENVKHAVEDTVATMKSSVRDTVDAVSEAFNLAHHVERRPWTMVAGAAAVGFVGGYMLTHKSRDERADEKFRHLSAAQGMTPQGRFDGGSSFDPVPPTRRATESSRNDTRGMTRSDSGPTIRSQFTEWLKPASSQLQAMAIGAALGIVRDMVVKSVPKTLEDQATELINGLTTSLGGEVIRGRVLEQYGLDQRGQNPPSSTPQQRWS